ncbi:rho-related protein racC [Anoplophora glabripennis]|uniref:rho-related protein racC n=1 Tax=Anoplophora glabripennis TaxID=217634 RepID=UPI0008757FDB|nr:rho-related protein racC [Anoplophora glabripennis]
METTTDDFTIALIGDGYVGKTCVLNCLQKSTYSKNSAPNVYNEMTLEKVVGNRRILFKIIDTAGQEEYDNIRKRVYEKADIFLLCFCVADKVSYENVTSKWMPDLYSYRNKPIILLGTKVDLRINSSSTSISRERGIRLQRRIGAKFYVECSSKSGEGIPNIIEAASNVLLTSRQKKSCVVQ